MRTFVMGDIHGTYKALMQCLERCHFNYEQDTLIQLGDITDGHDDVFLCVEELLKIKHLVAIKGNHDEWFSTFLATGIHNGRWSQGGRATAVSYLRLNGREQTIKRSGNGYTVPLENFPVPDTHRRFFEQQRLYYIDEHNNCFVHAGFDRRLPFTDQPAYLYYWDRNLWADALVYEQEKQQNRGHRFDMATLFNTIFIGHTSTTYFKTDKPMEAANICNIDTGAGHSGLLTIMDVDTKAFWQSDPVAGLYATNYR